MGSGPSTRARNRTWSDKQPQHGKDNSAKTEGHQPGAKQSSESSEEQKMAIVLFFIVALYLGLFTSLISH